MHMNVYYNGGLSYGGSLYHSKRDADRKVFWYNVKNAPRKAASAINSKLRNPNGSWKYPQGRHYNYDGSLTPAGVQHLISQGKLPKDTKLLSTAKYIDAPTLRDVASRGVTRASNFLTGRVGSGENRYNARDRMNEFRNVGMKAYKSGNKEVYDAAKDLYRAAADYYYNHTLPGIVEKIGKNAYTGISKLYNKGKETFRTGAAKISGFLKNAWTTIGELARSGVTALKRGKQLLIDSFRGYTGDQLREARTNAASGAAKAYGDLNKKGVNSRDEDMRRTERDRAMRQQTQSIYSTPDGKRNMDRIKQDEKNRRNSRYKVAGNRRMAY